MSITRGRGRGERGRGRGSSGRGNDHGGGRGRGSGRGGGGGRGGGIPLDTSVTLSPVLSFNHTHRGGGGGGGGGATASAATIVRAITDEVHVDELVLRLASDANLERLATVLATPCRVDGAQRTFTTVLLPILEFVVSPKFKQSPHSTAKKTIYRRILNTPLFLARLATCFTREYETLQQLGLLQRSVVACADLLYQLCTKIPNDDPIVYETAHKIHTWLHSRTDDQDVAMGLPAQTTELLEQTLDVCEGLVAPDVVKPRHGRPVEAAAAMAQYRVAPQTVHRVQLRASDDDDGNGRGSRHDNDHADYRAISLLPTHGEICCLEEPRLPLYPESNAPLATITDFHFRLVREDMLAQLRRGIQWFLGGAGLAQWRASGRVEPPRRENIPNLLVCSNVEWVQVACHSRKGVYFTLRAAQPAMRVAKSSEAKAAKAKTAARHEFWGGNNRLSVGSLVALALGVARHHAPQKTSANDATAFPRMAQLRATHVFFGQIAHRVDHELMGNDQTITTHVKFAPNDAPHVLSLLRRQQLHTDAFLIETAGVCFPPTQAILRTLQSYDVVQPPSLLEQIFTEASDAAYTAPPVVDDATGDQFLNLQHLVVQSARTSVDLRRVPLTTFTALCEELHPLEQRGLLKLDGSQVEAFAAAMTRACCLIQGPPGTGKSYVGVKIVETILAQRPRAARETPILCVCYTNHALDQFLEDLVTSGACALSDIVRIGGSSKSEMVQTRNLMKLETAQTMDERCTFGRVFKECKRQEEEVFTQFNDKKNAGGSFLKWLQRRHNAEYRAIVRDTNSTRTRNSYFGDDDYEEEEYEEEDDDDDGFETHDSRGKTPAERWKSWIKGKTRPAWLPDAAATDLECLPHDSVLRECENGDIWRLSKPRRKHCVDVWTSEWLDHSSQFLADAMKKYLELVDQMNELNQASRLRILRSAKIVGMTTTGCAQNQELVHALAPKVVVCEEAGEVLEAHLLSCLTPGIQQLIQIGDHLQLRPTVTEYKLSAVARRGFNLDISLFERLVRDRLTLYRDNIDLMRRRGVLVTLQTQRRMRPEIADLVRFTLYPSLQDSPVVHAYPNVKGFRDNVWFFDHDYAETSNESTKTNKFEAEMLVELVAYALKQGYAGDEIAVLTPYLGQLRLIRRLLSLKSMRVALEERDAEALALLDEAQRGNHDEDEDETTLAAKTTTLVGSVSMQQIVRLSTVDNFQGDEATLVFISTVRCNKDNNSGFLKTANRINVMLSRAKHGMVVLGSSRTVRHENKADMFLKVLDILEERACIGQHEIVLTCQRHGTPTRVACAMDIRNLTPDGGCLAPCLARLPCGHACPKMCHFDDPTHELVQCLEPCDKRIDACGHFCHKRCSAACVCDHVYSEQTLPCGHVVTNVSCAKWQQLQVQPCTRLVQVEMAVCGHVAMLPCPEARTIQAMGANAIHSLTMQQVYQCGHKCGGVREGCDHTCTRPCGQCLEATANAPSPRALQQLVARGKQTHAGTCQRECDRAMACGHYCATVCHPAGQCPPCDKPCENKCSHSVCESKCSDVCASCSQACGWHCAHTNTTCPLPCGSPCIQLPCTKRCEKRLADCGHQCPGLCGEPCLSSAYCRECGPAVAHSGEIVDLVMYATLSDHDPTESPLIRLGCGHALTVETLDGVMDISQFYTQTTTSGTGEVTFTSARPLEPKRDWTAQFKCPHCRFLVVGGVNRYARVLKYAQTRNGELKFLQEVRTRVHESQTFCAAQATQLSGDTAVTSSTAKAVAQSVRKHYNQWKTRVRLPTPTQELMTKELSRLDRLQLEAKTLNLAAYRQVIMKQSLIQVRLELLRVFALWMQATAACDEAWVRTAVRAKAWPLALKELMARERELLTLCDESQSQQSKWEARVAGVKLRCWFVVASSRHCEDEQLVDSVKTAIQDQYQEMQQRETARSRADEVASLAPLVDQVFRPATFYQQMTPEEKRSVQQAMGYDHNGPLGFGGYGGHWYQCPNGHPYVITECGGAMQQSTCPECQAPIGGGDHRTVAGNTSAQAYFEQA